MFILLELFATFGYFNCKPYPRVLNYPNCNFSFGLLVVHIAGCVRFGCGRIECGFLSKKVDSGNAAKEVVSPSMVDKTMAKEKQSSLVDTTGLGFKPSGTKVNFHTLFTPRGNGIDVVIPVESIRAISERFANIAYVSSWESGWPTLLVLTISMDGLDAMLENDSWFIRNNLLILKKWHPDVNLLKDDVGTVQFGLNSMVAGRAMIELRADVELKDNIVVSMPKITGDGYYTCNIRVQYEWKPHRNKKNNVEPTKEVSKSNLFEVLTSVENDVELVLVPFPIIEKIDKIEKLIIDGKVTLMDDEGKPLEKVIFWGNYDSEYEVASVDNEMDSLLAKKDGYDTQSLLEQ
ncbi:hypothetical protein Tco_1246739 [Tanacetum coccineum]